MACRACSFSTALVVMLGRAMRFRRVFRARPGRGSRPGRHRYTSTSTGVGQYPGVIALLDPPQ